MRKMMFICIMLLSFIFTTEEVLATEEVFGEKVWSVTMTQKILNTEENLSKIYVLNEDGNLVETKVEVSERNSNVIEVSSETVFPLGQYTLVIPSGIVSEKNISTTEDVKKIFTVKKVMDSTTFTDLWETEYMHKGELLDIKVKFDSGNTSIAVIKEGIAYTGKPKYEIYDGRMIMEIQELNLILNGKIEYYNENIFKIVTKSGNRAYFKKVN